MRTSINKKSDFDFVVLDSEGNAIDMPTSDFTLDLWTWGSKCRFRASSIGGVLKGCKNDGGKLRVYVDNPGFVPGKLVGEWITYSLSEDYADGSQRTCRYISDFGIDMVDGDSITNEQQVLAMMQYIQGASAYEIACEYGFSGTEEEWLNSLSLESVNAANECRELMTQLSAAEDERNANEQNRNVAEDERSTTEQARVTAENNRAKSEADRNAAEKNRATAELNRDFHESTRSTAETQRVSAENERIVNEQSRVAAEESRVTAEESRQANEQTRETAEASRIAAEEERVRTHNRLKTAMREYADAESLREESEAERREAEQYRIEYETARQSAEATRATAERSRATAENERTTNETARSDAENRRVTAETARQSAETARQEAEQGRATAEQQRAEAEAARVEEFATFEGKIAAKEDAANKVTSIGADANNTTFPTTRAVLNSIAEVKNKEVTPEMLSESTKQYINASGGGTITNLADDEDLTSVGNVLKLADKDYSPTSYSGMGRVYLRKNMVDGKNILTQEMMTKENTIYIIQYDYDLNGATINVPANCTLDFQGGSLSNGTVVFSNTLLLGKVQINCDFNGQVENNEVYISWFGDRADDIYYHKILEQTYSILKSGVLKLDGKKYDVNAIELKSNVSIDLCGSEVRQISGSNNTPIFSASNCTNIEIFNGIINGNKDNVSGNNSNGIRFISCKNFCIKNIVFKNIRRGCIICWDGCEMFNIHNVSASDCGLPNSISTLIESYDCHYFNLSLIKFINSYGVGIYTHSCTDFNINTAMLSDIGIDNGLTTEECYRFTINNVIVERNSNVGIEINASANFKLINCESRYNVKHNVLISTFKADGYSQSYLGVIENLITEGAGSEYNGLKITSGTNIDVCNCHINDSIFLTKSEYNSELITLRNVKSPLLHAINTNNLVLINCIIDSITGNSNPARLPLVSNDKTISRYIGGTLKTGEYIEIELPGYGNVTNASGTLDILTIFQESFSQNCKSLISFKVIDNTLTQDIISKIPGSVTRELTLSNNNNKLIIRNDTNVSLMYRVLLNAVYL